MMTYKVTYYNIKNREKVGFDKGYSTEIHWEEVTLFNPLLLGINILTRSLSLGFDLFASPSP